ncbi:MAG TPA: hypothetical protein PKD15_03775 [Candidatus Saccharibacteria bacterium]|jgi:hypothetical protein|nr:hypothetical protein [Candidatus Saccharibacteria bacterium]
MLHGNELYTARELLFDPNRQLIKTMQDPATRADNFRALITAPQSRNPLLQNALSRLSQASVRTENAHELVEIQEAFLDGCRIALTTAGLGSFLLKTVEFDEIIAVLSNRQLIGVTQDSVTEGQWTDRKEPDTLLAVDFSNTHQDLRDISSAIVDHYPRLSIKRHTASDQKASCTAVTGFDVVAREIVVIADALQLFRHSDLNEEAYDLYKQHTEE